MAVIVRIDVDRAYGKKSKVKQLFSRIASDFHFPRIQALGYLSDLATILEVLNAHKVRAYVFVRQCTLPSISILKKIQTGRHILGLHLENSRSFETFRDELIFLETYVDRQLTAFSKHGSGIHRYGRRHYPPYESERYIAWAKKAGMKVFMGNGEDPDQTDFFDETLHVFPAAYWLEPYWRDESKYNCDWILKEAVTRDVVLLFHPDNVTADTELFKELLMILKSAPTGVLRDD